MVRAPILSCDLLCSWKLLCLNIKAVSRQLVIALVAYCIIQHGIWPKRHAARVVVDASVESTYEIKWLPDSTGCWIVCKARDFGPAVDIIAPGLCIFSTMPVDGADGADGAAGYGTLTGTSFAAPHVAGAAALWISKNPSASPAEVRNALIAAGSFDWNNTDDGDNYKEPLVDVSSF